MRKSQSENEAVHACLAAQSCPTLCDHMDYNSSGSSVHGILQEAWRAAVQGLSKCQTGLSDRTELIAVINCDSSDGSGKVI